MAPNILIILADDLGTDIFRIDPASKAVAAHVVGQTSSAGPVPLPTFARMVQSGVHFQHAWSHPVCTPTRASLWTGMQPWRTGLGAPGLDDPIPTTTVTGEAVKTLAERLSEANSGYSCAMFGKWDLSASTNPVARGWSYFAGTFRGSLRTDGVTQYGFSDPGRISWARLNEPSSNPAIQAKRQAAAAKLSAEYGTAFLQNNPDLRFYIWEKDIVKTDGTIEALRPPSERTHAYATADQVHDAKAWIAAREGQGPWCVALNLITPHDPLHVPPPGTFKPSTIPDPTKPTIQQMLVAMMESMDYYVADLLASLGNQLANTVVIFMGDNGTQDRDPDTRESVDAQLGDDKSSDQIGGAQVPMIIADGGLMAGRAPCFLAGGPRSVSSLVHVVDVYNTALEIAGVRPASVDSISIAPQLRQTDGPTRAHNFAQMFLLTGGRLASGSVCDREYKYKLTCSLLTQNFQLVDRNGNPSSVPVYDYTFYKIEPESSVPGSFIDTPITGVLSPNTDGTFSVTNPTYAPKIFELYAQLQAERLDSNATRFPSIVAPSPVIVTPNPGPASVISLDSVVNVDGRIEVFAIEPSQSPWSIEQAQPNSPSFAGWKQLDGKVSQLTSVREPTGKARLFGIGTDGALWTTTQVEPSGASWTPWRSLGGVVKQIVAAANSDGRTEVFGIGSDNALWHIWQTAPGSDGFSGWSGRGGTVKQIAVGRNSDGRLEVFGIGSDDGLWHIYQTRPSSGPWSGWSGRGGRVKQIVVENNSDGRLEVFGIGTDNALWHIWQAAPSSGPWSGWASLGGGVKRIAAARNADGRITAFAIGTDDAIWTISQTAPSNGWGGWQSIGGRVVSQFTVEANADGRLEVFGIGSDGGVWTANQNAPGAGAWSAWRKLGGDVGATAPTSFNPAGTRWAVGVMDDNGMVSGPHPTPWEFGVGTMQAPPYWTGTYTPIAGQANAISCRITVSGTTDAFETHFVSPTRFVCTKNGMLYRFGKKL